MTHELKKIVLAYQAAKEKGMAATLATVVALDGSSYRRPGVSMLILEDGSMVGAVSGGCVEKEIKRQASSVFKTQVPKVMTYDGRYRLGCEGILYILLEPFNPDETFISLFWNIINIRADFQIKSYYNKEEGTSKAYGSILKTNEATIAFRTAFEASGQTAVFSQKMSPCFRLLVMGAEHDAVQICSYAALTGWEVIVVVPPDEQKSIKDFPGAHEFLPVAPEEFDTATIDDQTAIILMTHSFVKDLKFLLRLKDITPIYLGLLGPALRREKLLGQFLEHSPEVPDAFFDSIHGPAGIGIGAETPQEIAISVLSEIISVVRQHKPIPLKDKKGTIHSR
ncbi:XdhC family protein [Muriicola sp. Z0-33]|uniref:XdhC family protein n=1 Tax=Muriicola sp. Z0-33 TaxID=2816957 RepID=UPI002238ED45|nr:XdhC family protein [Muriicola sp. Z0-33]MCW5515219.1 XdhC family protein [Muriicola sp. Z0-33]